MLIKYFYVILASLSLAVVFNYLFFYNQIGISVLIFVSALLGVVLIFGRTQQLIRLDALQKSWWLVALIVFFSLMPAVHANGFLTFLNIAVTFALLMLLAYQLVGMSALLMKFRDYVVLTVLVPFRMLARMFSTISFISQVRSKVKSRDMGIRIFKGVLMALPVLIVFGILFSNADLVFSEFLNGIADITVSEVVMQYIALLGLAFILGFSYLSFVFFPKPLSRPPAQSAETVVTEGKGVEVLVFLGLIATLFIIFIGFQITYLFGGDTNIVSAGFTYAEYARRGFWELLAVSILSLLVLLATEKYAGAEMKKENKFIIPAMILIVEVGIVMFSAFKRLSLYIDAYGMTSQRFYVAGAILLLLVLFILLAVKFLKSKSEQFFAFSTLLSMIVFLIVVNAINPDSYIAKSNIERYNQTGKVDVFYVGGLSSDATAHKLELYNNLSGEDKDQMKAALQSQKIQLQESRGDWQSANIARAKSLKLLQDF